MSRTKHLGHPCAPHRRTEQVGRVLVSLSSFRFFTIGITSRSVAQHGGHPPLELRVKRSRVPAWGGRRLRGSPCQDAGELLRVLVAIDRGGQAVQLGNQPDLLLEHLHGREERRVDKLDQGKEFPPVELHRRGGQKQQGAPAALPHVG